MPKVSVVIPTKNRATLVAKAIDKIECQTVPREHYEVIAIDNNSIDDTRAVLEQKAVTYPNLKSGVQKKPGAGATRNAGLEMASGDIVLFIDDDVQAEPGLIEAHLDCHQKNSNVSAIGSVTMPWGETPDPFLRYLRDHGIFTPYLPSKGPIDFSSYHTCNASTPAKTLLNTGGFNECFKIYGMEDIELGYRLETNGCRMVFAPDAQAVHHRFPEFEEFVERSERAGYSLGQFIRLHPELKNRFVENNRIAKRLRSIHSFYPLAAGAMSPFITLLICWEKTRGSRQLSRLMDLHYNWSIRYHIFIGYNRFFRDQDGAFPEPASPVQNGFAPRPAMKLRANSEFDGVVITPPNDTSPTVTLRASSSTDR